MGSALFPADLPRALQSFEILQRLGAGGVGQVYLARSKSGRLVAIKMLSDAPQAAGTFAREASLCARLQHPTIVQVRAFIEDEGCAALVFEYVAGVALGRLLRFCTSHGVRLPDRAAWHVVERVLSALAYAHSFKDDQLLPTPIVHRDVSPANVLVDWNGGVKLTDFGIAKMIGVSPTTRVGLVKGTLGCMAPEQARGDEVTERADVYAAALLAWRLATGRVPFAKHQKDEFELLRAMRNPRIKPLAVLRPDLPEPLLDAIAQALEPEPEKRTLTSTDFAQIVRTHVDVAAGCVELGSLLDRWKTALERTVRRGGADLDGDSSDQRVANTVRYEEVALSFDDDAPPEDGPTFEAAALPSDAAILATLPVDDAVALPVREHPLPEAGPPSSQPPPPPATVELPSMVSQPDVREVAASPSTVKTEPPANARRPPPIGRIIAAAIVVVLVLAVAIWAALRGPH